MNSVLLARNWYQQPGVKNVCASYSSYSDAAGPYGHALQEHVPLASQLPLGAPIL
jgi:hypothetical protein